MRGPANSLTKKAPYKGLGADSEEKHEPVSDIDAIVVDSLKALDPEWPIREATLLFGIVSAQRSDVKGNSRHSLCLESIQGYCRERTASLGPLETRGRFVQGMRLLSVWNRRVWLSARSLLPSECN
jgi:hypothetical protein